MYFAKALSVGDADTPSRGRGLGDVAAKRRMSRVGEVLGPDPVRFVPVGSAVSSFARVDLVRRDGYSPAARRDVRDEVIAGDSEAPA